MNLTYKIKSHTKGIPNEKNGSMFFQTTNHRYEVHYRPEDLTALGITTDDLLADIFVNNPRLIKCKIYTFEINVEKWSSSELKSFYYEGVSAFEQKLYKIKYGRLRTIR
jgi:hypothetical protein